VRTKVATLCSRRPPPARNSRHEIAGAQQLCSAHAADQGSRACRERAAGYRAVWRMGARREPRELQVGGHVYAVGCAGGKAADLSPRARHGLRAFAPGAASSWATIAASSACGSLKGMAVRADAAWPPKLGQHSAALRDPHAAPCCRRCAPRSLLNARPAAAPAILRNVAGGTRALRRVVASVRHSARGTTSPRPRARVIRVRTRAPARET
jgi:hypothetical protein